MEKGTEEYKEIFFSPTKVPLHFQDKHSINPTPSAMPHDIAIPYEITQKESTHVLSEEIFFIEHIQHVH